MKNGQKGFGVVTIFYAVIVICLLIGIGLFIYKRSSVQNFQSASTSIKVDANNDAKFYGNVTSTDFNKDNCTLTLDDRITVIYCFNSVQLNEQPHGHVIDFGTLILSKKAEVYAHKTGSSAFTLAGSDKYYLKGIK